MLFLKSLNELSERKVQQHTTTMQFKEFDEHYRFFLDFEKAKNQ